MLWVCVAAGGLENLLQVGGRMDYIKYQNYGSISDTESQEQGAILQKLLFLFVLRSDKSN